MLLHPMQYPVLKRNGHQKYQIYLQMISVSFQVASEKIIFHAVLHFNR